MLSFSSMDSQTSTEHTPVMSPNSLMSDGKKRLIFHFKNSMLIMNISEYFIHFPRCQIIQVRIDS